MKYTDQKGFFKKMAIVKKQHEFKSNRVGTEGGNLGEPNKLTTS